MRFLAKLALLIGSDYGEEEAEKGVSFVGKEKGIKLFITC